MAALIRPAKENAIKDIRTASQTKLEFRAKFRQFSVMLEQLDLQTTNISQKPRTVAIRTLGCKVNTFDSQALAKQFQSSGFLLVGDHDSADVTVINTCSVTSKAEKDARYLARKIRRTVPTGMLVFTGCYAQTDSEALSKLPEIDLIVPNERKTELVTLVADRLARSEETFSSKLPDGVKAVSENRQGHFKSSLTLFANPVSSRTRTFLKVQDGCNGFCSYCLIPYARGASISVPLDQIVAVARECIAAGVGEIVLTGIHIGDYGRDLVHDPDQNPFVALLRELLSLSGLPRLRISSLEPSEVTRPLLELMAERPNAFCDHFHLPLQSGHDEILRKMRRTYDVATYRRSVEEIRRVFPEASIGADVMVGFPGETDEQFASSVDLCRDLRLSYLHVFPYSKRPNTSAARLPGHLSAEVVKERSRVLRQLSAELQQNYQSCFIGKSLEILWQDERTASGSLIGLTRNYLRVSNGAGDSVSGSVPGDLEWLRVTADAFC